MSWSEVKKINGNLAKPLDVLIAEQIASQSQTLQANITNAQNSTVSSVTNSINANINNLSNVTQNGGVKVVKSVQHGVIPAGTYQNLSGVVTNFLSHPTSLNGYNNGNEYGRYGGYIDIPISPVDMNKSILSIVRPSAIAKSLESDFYYFVSNSAIRLFLCNSSGVIETNGYYYQDIAIAWNVIEFY